MLNVDHQEIWQERFGLDRAGESSWSSRLTYQDDDHHHDRHPPPPHHPKSLPWSPSSSMVGTCRRQNPAMLIADNSSPWVEFGHGGNKPWSWWWSRWPSSRGALHTRWEPIPFQQVSQAKPNQTKPMIMTMMFRRFPAWEDESWRALEAGQPKTRAGGFWWKLCWFCCSIIVIVIHIPINAGDNDAVNDH